MLWFRSKSLGLKLVVAILFVNALLSAIAASVQLYSSYQRDRAGVIRSIETIDHSFRLSFENALWEYNYGLLDALLDGIFSRADVEYVKLAADDQRVWLRGELPENNTLVKHLALFHKNKAGNYVEIGKLTIGLSLADAQARVWAQFWTLMLSNFVKTVIASLIMLALFKAFVTRHLHAIATHVARNNWLKVIDPLRLDRAEKDRGDDLGAIVSAINRAQVKSMQDYNVLLAEIQQRKLAEEKLLDQAKSLEQANKEQAEFTYAISHDLKSPTNTVAMLLNELMLSCGDTMPPEGKQLIDISQNTIARMGRLIEDVLHYSRTIGENTQLEVVDVAGIMNELIEDLQADIQEKQATIVCEGLSTVYANPVQLRMLLQNLVTNALKFSYPGRKPEVRISQQQAEDVGFTQIQVADNGIGIDEQYHHKVFGLFQRLHTFEEYPGTGIGLTLCQRIINNHGGRIRLHSSKGKGTCFNIFLKESRNA